MRVSDAMAQADERAARVKQILDMCDASRYVSGLSDTLTRKLTQGCMVLTSSPR